MNFNRLYLFLIILTVFSSLASAELGEVEVYSRGADEYRVRVDGQHDFPLVEVTPNGVFRAGEDDDEPLKFPDGNSFESKNGIRVALEEDGNAFVFVFSTPGLPENEELAFRLWATDFHEVRMDSPYYYLNGNEQELRLTHQEDYYIAETLTGMKVKFFDSVDAEPQEVLIYYDSDSTQACPADAKICPDGTTVGRTGPDCEFALCPEYDARCDYDDPDLDYEFKDPWTCEKMDFVCPYDSEHFYNECGCGCEKKYEIKDDKQLCENSGGTWRQFSNGCADSCNLARAENLGIVCTTAFVDSCDCGPHKCWNGEACEPNAAGCTEEAKMCPDGSTVSRTGPDCEFAPCPNDNACPEHWDPVCAQPVTSTPSCPEGFDCATVMPEPRTYSNKCYMHQDKARFLYKGECKRDEPVCGNGICEEGEKTHCPLYECEEGKPCPSMPCYRGTCPKDCEWAEEKPSCPDVYKPVCGRPNVECDDTPSYPIYPKPRPYEGHGEPAYETYVADSADEHGSGSGGTAIRQDNCKTHFDAQGCKIMECFSATGELVEKGRVCSNDGSEVPPGDITEGFAADGSNCKEYYDKVGCKVVECVSENGRLVGNGRICPQNEETTISYVPPVEIVIDEVEAAHKMCAAPEPRTYSNKCELKREGAHFLYEGECRRDKKEYPYDCPNIYAPVCSSNGETYSNECEARKAHAAIECKGECPCRVECDNGCLLDEVCVPIGLRSDGKYCDIDKNFKEQKSNENTCNNNFECTSNVCVNSQCIESGLMQKIINFFRKLF